MKFYFDAVMNCTVHVNSKQLLYDQFAVNNCF